MSATQHKEIKITIMPAFQDLFTPSRYKVYYGGRGSGKSMNVRRALIAKAASQDNCRILCAREFQTSMRDSVHQSLSDDIKLLGLDTFFEIQNNYIKGKNGSIFYFEGLHHNIDNIKSSYESVDYCWVEEAESVSKDSWDKLIPTIRKEQSKCCSKPVQKRDDGDCCTKCNKVLKKEEIIFSEIWVTFNPRLFDDETYQRFVVHKPVDSIVKKVNFFQNPMFPKVLQREMNDLRRKSMSEYKHIWLGECRSAVDGAIYAEQIAEMDDNKRITDVPHDPSLPVYTAWDIGDADYTAIIFAQKVGQEVRILKSYQNRRKDLQHYIDYIKSQPYTYAQHFLPHDSKQRRMGQVKTVEQQIKSLLGKVKVVKLMKISDGLDLVRSMLRDTYIDRDNNTDLIQAARQYRYKVDEKNNVTSLNPIHDDFSHIMDALRYLASGIPRSRRKLAEHEYSMSEDEPFTKLMQPKNQFQKPRWGKFIHSF